MDENKKLLIEALKIAKGNITEATSNACVARATFYNWMKTDPEFAEAAIEAQEIALDYVESKLFEKITGVAVKKGETDDGEPIVYDVPPSDAAIIFYLKTKGKKRGYVERQEMTGPDGQALPAAQTGIFIGVDYSKLPSNVLDSILEARITNGGQ